MCDRAVGGNQKTTPERRHSGSKTQPKNEMDTMEEKKSYPSQRPRISQGSAVTSGIVPAPGSSSSDYGLNAGLPTGSAPEYASVVEEAKEIMAPNTGEAILQLEPVEDQPQTADQMSSEIALTVANASNEIHINIEKDRSGTATIISVVSIDSEDMDYEASKPAKRKMARSSRSDFSDSGDSDPREKTRTRLHNRCKFSDDEEHKRDKSIIQVAESDPDTSSSKVGEQAIARKEGRPRKKKMAIDPKEMERAIIKKAGQAPEHLDV